MKRVLGSALITVGAVLITSCGSDSTSFTAASGTVTQAQATSLKSDLTKVAQDGLGAPNTLPTIPSRGTIDECTTKTPADSAVTDADGDHIKTQKKEYKCTGATSKDNATVDLNGTVDVKDENDNDKWSGYSYSYDLSGKSVYSGSTSTTYQATYKGNWKLTKDSGSGAYSYTSDHKNEGTKTQGSTSYSYTSGGNWTYKVTPTTAPSGSNKGTGSAEISGFYAGYFEDDRAAKATNYVLKMTSEGLKYDSSCTKYYKEGSITYEDGSANKIKLTFGCTTVTATYNSTTI